jgi:hypothetical protein
MNKPVVGVITAALVLVIIGGISGGILYHSQSVRADAATAAAATAQRGVDKIEATRLADAKALAAKQAIAAHDKAVIDKAVAAAKAVADKTAKDAAAKSPKVVVRTVTPKTQISPPDPYQAAYDAFGFHPGSVCREMFDRGWAYTAMYSWFISHGYPAHMDVDGDLIPCETIYA